LFAALIGANFLFDVNHSHHGERACNGVVGSQSCQWAFYLNLPKNLDGGMLQQTLLKTGTWILIFTNFVPISLMVTLEIVKLWQSIFMSYDVYMYDEE